MHKISILVVIGFGFSSMSQGADPAANRIIFPVTTDLQRLLLNERECRAVVLLNGSEMISGTEVDAKSLDLKRLREELQPYADQAKGVVSFEILMGQKSFGFDRQTTDLMTYTLEGFGQRAGFHRARVSTTMYVDWDERMARVNDKTRVQSEGDESAVGDDSVKAYPVQTILSWYLMDSCDCVVDIRIPLSKPGSKELDPGVGEATASAVKQLKIKDRSSINFRVSRKMNSPEIIEVFEKDHSISKSLGFEKQTVTRHFN
jgi:hypothetical protein